MLTLALLNPAAVKRGLAGKIVAHLEAAGFAVHAARLVKLSNAQAESFYEVHRDRPFYRSLVTFMTSGPRRHEGHQGAVKGTVPMHFVEGLGLRVAELDEAGGVDGEPGGLQVRNDLSREASLDRVGLDDGECEHVKGLGAKGLRGYEAANDVGARQESYHNPLPHYGEAVHVLGTHQIGDVREGLVLRQAEDGTSHRLPRRDELRIGRAALQLGARGRVKLSGLGALHEVRDQETQQLTVRDHPDERAG